jgi:hypothetical protein
MKRVTVESTHDRLIVAPLLILYPVYLPEDNSYATLILLIAGSLLRFRA